MRMKAEYLLVVRMGVVPEKEEEFNEWYNNDHIPALTSVKGVLSGRRYVSIIGEPKYVAVYELESPEALESEEYAKARDSEWTVKMRPYFRNHTRNVYKLIYAHNGFNRST